jgi:hypothetical protein
MITPVLNDGFSAYFYQIVGWAMLFCPPFEGNSFKSSWAQKACPPYRAYRLCNNRKKRRRFEFYRLVNAKVTSSWGTQGLLLFYIVPFILVR